MVSLASLLPRSVGEWTLLLRRALELPPSQVRYPKHFDLRTASGGYSMLPQRMAGRRELTTQSSVLVLLAPTSTETDFQDMCITLTKRSSQLRNHKSEMSFPGGHLDDGESAVDAAQRETFEETGVPAAQYTVVGCLEPIQSLHEKGVVAVVAVADTPVSPDCGSPAEVESIHYLHLSSLLARSAETHCCASRVSKRGGNQLVLFPCFFASTSQNTVSPRVEPSAGVVKTASDGPHDPLLARDYPGEIVWGLTAIMLCEILARVATQVARDHPDVPAAAALATLRCTNVVARPPEVEQ